MGKIKKVLFLLAIGFILVGVGLFSWYVEVLAFSGSAYSSELNAGEWYLSFPLVILGIASMLASITYAFWGKSKPKSAPKPKSATM